MNIEELLKNMGHSEYAVIGHHWVNDFKADSALSVCEWLQSSMANLGWTVEEFPDFVKSMANTLSENYRESDGNRAGLCECVGGTFAKAYELHRRADDNRAYGCDSCFEYAQLVRDSLNECTQVIKAL